MDDWCALLGDEECMQEWVCPTDIVLVQHLHALKVLSWGKNEISSRFSLMILKYEARKKSSAKRYVFKKLSSLFS
jgi:hypothetical protein